MTISFPESAGVSLEQGSCQNKDVREALGQIRNLAVDDFSHPESSVRMNRSEMQAALSPLIKGKSKAIRREGSCSNSSGPPYDCLYGQMDACAKAAKLEPRALTA
jgi:hypothetical protein